MKKVLLLISLLSLGGFLFILSQKFEEHNAEQVTPEDYIKKELTFLSDKDPTRRRDAAEKVIALGTQAAPIMLKTLEESEDDLFRQGIIGTLGQMSEQAKLSKPALHKLLAEDNSIMIVIATMRALLILQEPEEKILLALEERLEFFLDNLSPSIPQVENYICIFWGKEAVASILKKLEEKEEKIPFIQLLGKIGHPQAGETLFNMLETRSEQIDSPLNIELIKAMGRIGYRPARESIEKILASSEISEALRDTSEEALLYINFWYGQKSELSPELREKTEETIDLVYSFLDDLNSYELDNVSTLSQRKGKKAIPFIQVSGKITGVKEKKFLLQQNIEYLQGNQPPEYAFLSFDGTYEWFYLGKNPFDGDTLNRIDMTTLALPGRPFDAWNSTGTGLLTGNDYPQTVAAFLNIYDFQWVAHKIHESGEAYIDIKGQVKAFPLMEYLAQTGQLQAFVDRSMLYQFMNMHSKIEMQVRAKDGAVMGWTLEAKQKSNLAQMVFEAKNITINPEIIEEKFSFPGASQVNDLTSKFISFFTSRKKQREKSLILLEEYRELYK